MRRAHHSLVYDVDAADDNGQDDGLCLIPEIVYFYFPFVETINGKRNIRNCNVWIDAVVVVVGYMVSFIRRVEKLIPSFGSTRFSEFSNE